MANPDLDKGYLRIANELARQFWTLQLNGREFNLIWYVLSKTYGFNKKYDWISLTQFQRDTHMTRSRICKIIKSLVSRMILVKAKCRIGINKNWEQWLVSRMILVSNLTIGSIKSDNLPSVKFDTHKRQSYKRQYTKDRGVSVLNLSENEKLFNDFVLCDCPELLKFKKPLLFSEYEKLIKDFGEQEVYDVMLAVANQANTTRKYISASRTIRNWCKMRSGKDTRTERSDIKRLIEQTAKLKMPYEY